MDGKEYFRECCKDLGIDASEFFRLGNQNGETKNRLRFKPSYNSEKHSQIFAVNYFSAYGIYVAWRTEVGRITKREVFSIKKEDVSHVPSNYILPISKAVEYSGWAQEMVYAFRLDSVKLFLQKYILSGTEKE